jgi:hypothetical protein
VTVTICSIDRTELSRRRQRGASDPDRSAAILKNRSDKQASKVRVPSEFAIFPTRQSSHCADPESAIAGDMETHDKIAGELFAIQRWLPMLDTDTIESKQSEAGAQPDVAVWRLRN